MIQLRAVFFDYDGPIKDSFNIGKGMLLAASRRFGIQVTPHHEKKLIVLWGLPEIEMLKQAFDIPDTKAKELYEEWVLEGKNSKISLVEGAREALRCVREMGIVTVLFTSRSGAYIAEELKSERLSSFFDYAYTKDNLSFLKPDPRAFERPLLELHKEFGIRKEECLFVGDTWTDAFCGSRAGVRTIIVLNGPYRFPEHAEKHFVGSGRQISSINVLLKWLIANYPIPILPES